MTRLMLSRETLRQLGEAEVPQVAGGATFWPTCASVYCPPPPHSNVYVICRTDVCVNHL